MAAQVSQLPNPIPPSTAFSPAQQSSAGSSATSPSSMADPPASGTEQRSTRVDVLSMLNAENVEQKAIRRSAAQMGESGTKDFPSSGLDISTTIASGGSVTGDPSYALRGNVQTGTIEEQQPPFLSLGSRVQSVKVMTISTGKGPVQIPVEMESKAAEKRKRNTAASSRCRRRRKEREQQASMRINELELQLEWYRNECQALLIALRTLPGGEQYLPREKSPLSRRVEPAGPTKSTPSQQSATRDGRWKNTPGDKLRRSRLS